MRAAYLLSFLSLALAALAAPTDQIVLGDIGYEGAATDKAVHDVIKTIHDAVKHTKETVNKWVDMLGRTQILQNGITCTYLRPVLQYKSVDQSRRARSTSRLPRVSAAGHGACTLRPQREAVLGLPRHCGG